MIDPLSPAGAAPIRQVNTGTLLYMYRPAGDQEVARYIQFLESEAGSWFGDATQKALVRGLVSAVEGIAAELVRVGPPERWMQGGGFRKPPLPSKDERL
jgi:hypothetical protein